MGHYDEAYEAQAREDSERLQQQRTIILSRLNDALVVLNSAPRSREHSIASTHIETAMRWLK